MKKLLGILTAVVLVWQMILPSYAGMYTISPESETIPNYQEVYTAIYEAINAQKTFLDVTSWKIKDYEIMSIFTDVMHNSPEFFYASQKLVYRYNKEGYVPSLSFTYPISRTKRKEYTDFYEEEISYIVNEIAEKRLSAVESALYAHDYIIASFSYDETETIYDAYNFLRERKGVCHAYSLCYMAVMRELGIPCFMVVSEEMNHSWNLVQIDGQWYHVDLVYDDPQPDKPGRVLHNHFLLSDKAIAEDQGQGPHYGWKSMIPCMSEQYDDAAWRSSSTRMLYLNDKWFTINEDTSFLESGSLQGEPENLLYRFTEPWYVYLSNLSLENTSRWKGLFTGLATYEGYLYYNTPTTIWRIHPSSGEKMVFLSLEEDAMNIYGITIYKHQMEYLVGDNPDRKSTFYVETIPMRLVFPEEQVAVPNVFLPFADVTRVSPHYASVEYLYEQGIMNGISSTEFSLNTFLTRAQFAALLSRLYRYNPSDYKGEALYSDVSTNSWYAPYVSWVTESGYMVGNGNGAFCPEEPVTREQVLTVLASVGKSQKLGQQAAEPLNTIDREMISSWALAGVDYCFSNGLILPKYQYMLIPKANVKRSEMADLLYLFCQLEPSGE